MERDLFAEIGAADERDLFGEIGFDANAPDPASSNRRIAAAVGSAQDAEARAATADEGDSWGEIGRKFVSRLGPVFQQAVGGGIQGFAETAADPGAVSVMGVKVPMFRVPEYEAELTKARKAGAVPGQELYESAARDLAENAYDPGDDAIKKYAPMVAESVVQMIPGVVGSIITRNPYVAGASMGAQVGGAQYGESAAEGRPTDKAFQDAAFMAVAETIGEQIPVGILMKPGGSFLASTLKAAGAEGAQEIVTQTLQTGYEMGVLNPDMTWGEALQQIVDAGIVGTFTGGALNIGVRGTRATVDATGRLVNRNPADTRIPPPGVLEQAETGAVQPTPEDIASPLDTADILAGRAVTARATASSSANAALESNAMPSVGQRVQITHPDGTVETGTMQDWFEDETGGGVVIERDAGRTLREYTDNLSDAGFSVTPLDPIAEADAIDAGLRSRAEEALARVDEALDSPALTDPSVATRDDYEPPVAAGDVATSFMNRVRGAESGGNDAAKNPRSSATGRYQFTDSTWLSYYKRRFGEQGLSDAQILAKRSDGAVQDQLMQDLTRDNADALRGAGVEVTEGNLYLAHFAGPGGAIRLFRADPNASVESVLGKAVVEANPFLKGMTAADAIAWAAGKMGGAAAPQFAEQDMTPTEPIPFAEQVVVEPGQVAPVTAREAASVATLDQPAAQTQPAVEPGAVDTAPQPTQADMRQGVAATTPDAAAPVGEAQFTARDTAQTETGQSRDPALGARATTAEIRPGDPLDLLRFVARNGGVSYDGLSEQDRDTVDGTQGHDLRGTGNLQTFVPGAGQLLRPTGKSLEEVGEALWEAGYFGPAETTPRPSETDVIEALDSAAASMAQRRGPTERIARQETEAGHAEFLAGLDRVNAAMDAWGAATDRLGMAPFGRANPALQARAEQYGIPLPAETETDVDVIVDFLLEVVNRQLDDARADAWYETEDDVYELAEDQFRGAAEDQGQAGGESVAGQAAEPRDSREEQEGDAGRAPRPETVREARDSAEGVEPAALDRGEATNSASLRRAAEGPTQFRADSEADARAMEIPLPETSSEIAWLRGKAAQVDVEIRESDGLRWLNRRYHWQGNVRRNFRERALGTGNFQGAKGRLAEVDEAGWGATEQLQSAGTGRGDSVPLEYWRTETIRLDESGQVDPAIAERQTQEARLRAEAPMRARQDQDGTMGLGLFDQADQPQMDLERGDAQTAPEAAETRRNQPSEGGAQTEAKRSETDDTPIVPAAAITGKTLPERRLNATQWYYSNLVGNTVTTREGLTVRFTKRGGDKTTSQKGDRLLAAVPAIREIIERGTVVRRTNGDRPGVNEAVWIAAPVQLPDGEVKTLAVLIRRQNNGDYHYAISERQFDPARSETDGAQSVPAMEGSGSGLNLFLIDDNVNGAPVRDSIDTAALQARLEEVGIARKVALKVVDSLGGAAGDFGANGQRMIRIATDTSQDAVFTLDHETIHALRELGLFNKSDWAILSAKARRDPGLMRSIKRRYGRLDAEAQTEEAVADMFARWQRGDYEAKGTIARLFQRVRDLFDAVRNAFAGQGLRSATDVMGDAASGSLARAMQGSTHPFLGARRDMVVFHGTPHDFDTFTLDAIGTGEGAQAYGWGLYFAGRREIAEFYREQLTRSTRGLYLKPADSQSEPTQIKSLRTVGDESKKFLQDLSKRLPGNPPWWGLRRIVEVVRGNVVFGGLSVDEALDQLRREPPLGDERDTQAFVAATKALIDADILEEAGKGRLFEVDIPEDGEYLLWDAPLSEQPEKVKKALRGFDLPNAEYGRDIYREVGLYASVPETYGMAAGKRASLTLRDAGIAGIKYLDLTGRNQRDPDGIQAEGDAQVAALEARLGLGNDAAVQRQIEEVRQRTADTIREAQENTTYNYVLFDDAAAKIIAKHSIPERADMVELGGQDPSFSGKMADAFERWRTTMQDRYLPLLKVQREIEQQTGRALPNNLNPYLGEELMSGRIGSRLEVLAEDRVAPLFDAMADARVTTEELETFLYARHAPERNARIREINPEFAEDNGSGMTDIEAAAVMNRIRKAGKMETMEALAAQVDAIRDFALDYRIETGLLSQEDADQWREIYKHYVPLRGFAESDGSPEAAARINRSGGGINVRGKESRRAFGRRSRADSPLAYLILQAEEAIVRGETNRVAQRFVDLATANPDPEFWTVQKVTARRRINEETGLVETYTTNQLLAEDKDFTVTAKFDGAERRVTMNRENEGARRLADSMRNLTQHQMDWFTLHLGKINRFLSAVNTSYNPEFVITNAFRDIQTAAVNLQGFDVDRITSGTLKDYPKALIAATKGAFRKGDGEWRKWYEEFIAEGGRVYFNRVEDVGELKKKIERTFAMAAAAQGEGNVRLHVKRGLLAARDLIENANSGVENAVRLSAYKNAREAGISAENAASIAKNLTVNFNRRGTAGPLINAAYLFYNASIQGSTRIFQAMRSRRVQKMLGGVVVGGAMLELLNAMLSGDDDDGESYYDKISDFDKSRNLIIMIPGGSEFVKIPLPYGYNAFFGAGRTVAEVARRGGDRWKESMANLAKTVADAFNPVGGTDSLLNFIAPTVADPVVDLSLNRDFAGRPIMPEQPPYDSPEPDFRRYWNSVGAHWRAVTDTLGKLTGGDEVNPGAIDVSPETLEYLSGVVLGAAGGFADRLASLGGKLLDPDVEAEANDFPFYRKVMGDKPGWYDKSAYYDRVNTIDLHIDRTKDYIEADMIDEARSYAMKHEAILTLEPAMKAAQKEMKAIRKARKTNEAAHERGAIDDATYRAEKQLVEDAEKMVITAFNTRWNETMAGE